MASASVRLVAACAGTRRRPSTPWIGCSVGTRAVRYGEAVALADVLNFPLPGIHTEDESPAETRHRHLDLAARHLRSKVNSASAAVSAAKDRLNAAKNQLDIITALDRAVSGKPSEVEVIDFREFGEVVISAVQEAGIPAQDFLDALELPPTDLLHDDELEPIRADMDSGYISIAITSKYPIKLHESWKEAQWQEYEDASDG